MNHFSLVYHLECKLLNINFYFYFSARHLQWKVITTPAVFNKPVELECTTGGVLNTNVTRKWERGSRILTSKNKSTDPKKYRERITYKSFILQILNFNISDLDEDYACIYGFDVHTSSLSITKANFERKYTI